MNTPRLAGRLALLLALCLASQRPALASTSDPGGPDGESSQSGGAQQKTTSQLLTDLVSDNKPNRLYAARALKQQLVHARHVVEHGREGTLNHDMALANLDELEARLPEQCMRALDAPNIVAPAAEMLALLGVQEALPKIAEARGKQTRKGVIRRLEAAEALLAGAKTGE